MKKLNLITELIGELLIIAFHLAVVIGIPVGIAIAIIWLIIKTANWLRDFIIQILNIIFS